MKTLILGAGFGTRLERDLKSPDGEFYSHLIGVPKPLLPIGKYPLATHWLRTMSEIRNVDDIFVVVCYCCIVTIGEYYFYMSTEITRWAFNHV